MTLLFSLNAGYVALTLEHLHPLSWTLAVSPELSDQPEKAAVVEYWRWDVCVFAEGKSHKPGGRTWNRTRDTGIFKLIALPLRLDKSHEYCVL
ncbi:MAG: hypothetical protein ACJA2O_003899 [Candidatus Azotimanducaceae bacterium]|jgi:hypothetical protein